MYNTHFCGMMGDVLLARNVELLELFENLTKKKMEREKAYGDVTRDLSTIEFQIESVDDEIRAIDRRRKEMSIHSRE